MRLSHNQNLQNSDKDNSQRSKILKFMLSSDHGNWQLSMKEIIFFFLLSVTTTIPLYSIIPGSDEYLNPEPHK